MTPLQASPGTYLAPASLAPSRRILFGAVLGLSIAGTGCLCPPCPTGEGATTPAAVVADQTTGPTPTVSPGGQLMIWDGEGPGTGAKPWSDCDKKPTCKSTLAAMPDVGIGKSTGLKFHGEGSGWMGMGWNWFGWYPETAGIDISPYTYFTFQIRVENASPETAVSPDAVTVLLGCSKGKQTSADVSPVKYEKDFADGKWHKVSIPVGDFVKGKAAAFDLKTAWELRISAWSATPVNFTIYVDQIAAEKQ